MPEFLALLPPLEALDRLLSHLSFPIPEAEQLATLDALGRVTAESIHASEPLPAFPRSTVDGYAALALDTFGASDSLPAYLKLIGEAPMGRAPEFRLLPGQAALIHTGGMLPEGADAVVMLENTQTTANNEIEVFKAAAAGENVVQTGEDVKPGQLLFPAGKRVRPAEIGGLMALGIMQVAVACQPRIGIISTGDELVAPEQTPQPGQVRDINSYSLAALVARCGGIPVRMGLVPDDIRALQRAAAAALAKCDALVITAGSSASARDLTAEVVNRLGKPGVLVHGVNVRPGKPTILAVCDGKAVIGLPGNPVSALVIAGLFVTPVIERLLGRAAPDVRPSLPARLTINLASQTGREDWVPARLAFDADGALAEPVFYKSSLIFSLAQADGLVRIPADATGMEVGEQVEVVLLQ
ncbi:MAG: gephyrin-like molybdotransferase Glp [Anaerolineaceae bacterium]|nr:gephyrin-like molybdotransferase Glp [Anaerolineaceae bacterium]